MALLAYLKLKGQKQGDLKGCVTQDGREGRIAVITAEDSWNLKATLKPRPATKTVESALVAAKPPTKPPAKSPPKAAGQA